MRGRESLRFYQPLGQVLVVGLRACRITVAGTCDNIVVHGASTVAGAHDPAQVRLDVLDMNIRATERINTTHSIRYPDPAIKVNDTVKIDLATGKITDSIRFDTGVIAMATGGRNMGRVGVITHRERHDGGFNIVHIKDAIDNEFATRESNVFVIGQEKPWISLPKGKGVKVSQQAHIRSFYVLMTLLQLTIAEERDRRRAQAIAGQ